MKIPKNKKSRFFNLPSVSSLEHSISLVSTSFQTSYFGGSLELNNFQKNKTISNIADMLSILIDRCQDFDAIQLRIRSVDIYMLLRYVNLTYEQTEELLSKLRLAITESMGQYYY